MFLNPFLLLVLCFSKHISYKKRAFDDLLCLFRIKTVQIGLWLYFISSFIIIGFDEIFPVFADSSKAYGKNSTMFNFRVIDSKLLSNIRLFPSVYSIR